MWRGNPHPNPLLDKEREFKDILLLVKEKVAEGRMRIGSRFSQIEVNELLRKVNRYLNFTRFRDTYIMDMKRILAVLIVVAAILTPPAFAYVGQMPMGRAMSVSLGSVTLTGVYPRIFTPNGDGANDKVSFNFDNPEEAPIDGKVFDITGAQVANLATGRDPTSQLLWDGKDIDGHTVPAGIYLYQIEFRGKVATGTVVVAR